MFRSIGVFKDTGLITWRTPTGASTTHERTRAVIIDECTYTHDTFPLSPLKAMQLKDRKEDCDNVSESSGDSWNLQF